MLSRFCLHICQQKSLTSGAEAHPEEALSLLETNALSIFKGYTLLLAIFTPNVWFTASRQLISQLWNQHCAIFVLFMSDVEAVVGRSRCGRLPKNLHTE